MAWAWAAWICVCVVWGTTYLAIRIALETLPPALMGAMRWIVASAILAAGLWLLVGEGLVGEYAIVDEFNIVFIVINTLVGFTTALFSASYIGHEIETGRLSPLFVRFYHATFQAMMGSMNVALVANNIGVMWVGLELATLQGGDQIAQDHPRLLVRLWAEPEGVGDEVVDRHPHAGHGEQHAGAQPRAEARPAGEGRADGDPRRGGQKPVRRHSIRSQSA